MLSDHKPMTPLLVAGDLFTSTVIGCTVAVPVTIIDYSIMMKVSGISPSISSGLKDGFTTLFLRPNQFFFKTPLNQYALIYRVVATVYMFTYLTSNATLHFMESKGYSGNEVHVGRGVVSGASNTLLTMWKDSFILQRLPVVAGAAAASSFVPAVSRIGFCVRDIITCVAAFTLVPMATDYLNRQKNNERVVPFASNSTISALTVPASMQVATTILHIACIRYQRTYPNPSIADVVSSLRNDYVGAVTARIGRIIPAFGIGGIGNSYLLDTTTLWARSIEKKQMLAAI